MHAPGEAGRRRVDCAAASILLPGVAAGEGRLDDRAERHVASCLRCQAELARYRKLRRILRGLGQAGIDPSPELLPTILAALDQAASGRSSALANPARWTVYVGGVATAGATAGVLVWLTRRRLSLAG